jgi:hypothetical protein
MIVCCRHSVSRSFPCCERANFRVSGSPIRNRLRHLTAGTARGSCRPPRSSFQQSPTPSGETIHVTHRSAVVASMHTVFAYETTNMKSKHGCQLHFYRAMKCTTNIFDHCSDNRCVAKATGFPFLDREITRDRCSRCDHVYNISFGFIEYVELSICRHMRTVIRYCFDSCPLLVC